MKKQLLLMLCIGFNAQLYCMEKAKEEKQEPTSLFDLCEGKKISIRLESRKESRLNDSLGVSQNNEDILVILSKLIPKILKKSTISTEDESTEIVINVDALCKFLQSQRSGAKKELKKMKDNEEVDL